MRFRNKIISLNPLAASSDFTIEPSEANIAGHFDYPGLIRRGVDPPNSLETVLSAEATFLFPSHKVFGFSGNNDRIDNNQPLVYKLKIINHYHIY